MLIPSASSQEYVGRGKPRASHWNWTFSVSTPSVSTGSVTQLGGSCTWWYRCTSEVGCQCLKSVVYWDVWSQLSMSEVSCLLEISEVSCLLRYLKSVVFGDVWPPDWCLSPPAPPCGGPWPCRCTSPRHSSSPTWWSGRQALSRTGHLQAG